MGALKVAHYGKAVLAAAALAVVLAPAGGAAAGEPPLAAGERKAIERIVRDYLLENPEIIVEAMKKLRERRREAARSGVRKAIAERRDEIYRDPGSPVAGDPAGDVTLVEFFDYRCGVCKRVHPVVAQLMRGDRRIRRIYKEWPILGADSAFAARAALAARRQGKYLAFHDALMEAAGGLGPATVMALARKVGIDTARLRRDMDDPEIDAILKRNAALADALDLKGTPSFVIGDTLVSGGRDLDTFRALIARARKRS